MPKLAACAIDRERPRRRALAHILVTGAAGFIGQALVRGLVERGHEVRGATRTTVAPFTGVTWRAIGDIGPETDWAPYLDGVDIVVHLASSAHRPIGAAAATEPGAAAKLARAARAARVERLVHISSIRAMGETTRPGSRFRPADPPMPTDPYGCAKLRIERAVATVAEAEGLDLVIVRPPLVYGPGVKGNFRALLALAASRLPLPFAGLHHRRSLIFLDNLVDLLSVVAIHPAASGRLLLARDTADFSLPELIEALGSGLGRCPMLFSVPAGLFTGLYHVPIAGAALRRLTLPLLVDDSETKSSLGWIPPVAAEIGLAETARAHRARV
jgi:nucleoside-diphosphate-sugar epimerase